jgi:hypothetical protein
LETFAVNDTLWAVVAIVIAAATALWFRLRGGSAGGEAAESGRSTTFFGPREIEGYVRDHIVEIAEEQFPDNRGLQWIVYGFQHREDLGLVFAEVEPRPDVVGYPRFQFAFLTPRTPPPKQVAAYCLESGKYTLLSKSGDAPRNLPKQLG